VTKVKMHHAIRIHLHSLTSDPLVFSSSSCSVGSIAAERGATVAAAVAAAVGWGPGLGLGLWRGDGASGDGALVDVGRGFAASTEGTTALANCAGRGRGSCLSGSLSQGVLAAGSLATEGCGGGGVGVGLRTTDAGEG